MATQAQWKQPDGAGGFDVIHHETSAEMVTYNGSTVKDYLDNAASTSISAQVRGLLSAEDAEEARQILNVSPDPFFDESGNRWHYTSGVSLSDEYAKFGTTSLKLSGSSTYLRRIKEVTLGGADFTIAFWAYATKASTSGQGLLSWGETNNHLLMYRDSSNAAAIGTTYNGNSLVATTSRPDFTTGQWNHVEICYRQSGNELRFFFNGKLVDSRTGTNKEEAFSTARTFPLYIGYSIKSANYFNGYINEFLISKSCLHTAAFNTALPTFPYAVDSNTTALLHFGMTKFTDAAGTIWDNYGTSLSTTQKKFGSKSLYVNNASLHRLSKVTLGGKDFSIAFWGYATAESTSGEGFFSWGNTTESLMLYRDGSNTTAMATVFNGGSLNGTTASSRPTFTTGQWNHVEIDYRQSDNTLMFFFNGELVESRTDTNFSTARTLPFYIGYYVRGATYLKNSYIDEFLITEKLLHDSDFSSDLPTSYSADEDTIALLNFE